MVPMQKTMFQDLRKEMLLARTSNFKFLFISTPRYLWGMGVSKWELLNLNVPLNLCL